MSGHALRKPSGKGMPRISAAEAHPVIRHTRIGAAKKKRAWLSFGPLE